MKVSFLTTWNIKCGIADYSRNLLHELRGLADVEVVAIEPYEGPAIDLFRSFDRKRYDDIAESLKKGDIVHIQHAYSIFGGELSLYRNFAYLVKRINKPLVMTLHEVYDPLPFIWKISGKIKIDFKTFLKNVLYGWTRYRERVCFNSFKKAKKIIVHTAAQAQVLKSVGLNAKVMPHGVPDFLARREPKESAKQKIGLKGKTVLLIFGFVNWRKGYELAIPALSRLPKDVVLVIAGGARIKKDEGYIRKLEILIKKFGLTDRVRMTGYLSQGEIADYINGADIVLAPFLTAAGSGSLNLSIAFGKPIVASDLPSVREINEHIPCLELFRSGESDDLYTKIERLLSDVKRKEALAMKTLEYSGKFSFNKTAQETMKIYETVLNSAP